MGCCVHPIWSLVFSFFKSQCRLLSCLRPSPPAFSFSSSVSLFLTLLNLLYSQILLKTFLAGKCPTVTSSSPLQAGVCIWNLRYTDRPWTEDSLKRCWHSSCSMLLIPVSSAFFAHLYASTARGVVLIPLSVPALSPSVASCASMYPGPRLTHCLMATYCLCLE